MANQEVSFEGRRRVEAELLQRGAGSVTFIGKRKSLLQATNSDHSRTGEIRVKTKRRGNWHTTINEAKPADKPEEAFQEVKDFWMFVDLRAKPIYWIVPDWWIRNDIYQAHQKYLSKHGGSRPKNDNSNHHSIDETRLEKWKGKWDILGIF